MIIYKIINNINNKIYIGLTTGTLKHRWNRHIQDYKDLSNTKPLYRAMRKYGIENFSMEIIDETDDIEKLGKLERFYIKKYESQNPKKGYNLTAGGERNQWDANPSAKVSYDEVVQIREIYGMGELSCKECWEIFKDKLS